MYNLTSISYYLFVIFILAKKLNQFADYLLFTVSWLSVVRIIKNCIHSSLKTILTSR